MAYINKQPSIIVASPDIRPSLMSILRGLHEENLLSKFVTTIAVNPNSIISNVLSRCSSKTNFRILPDFLVGKTDSFWSRELVRIMVSKLGHEMLTHKTWRMAEIAYDNYVARKYAGLCSHIYGMEHSSASTFRAQKKSGGKCLLRQVNAHGQKIIDVIGEQAKYFPEYVSPYHKLIMSESDMIMTRKKEEYSMADLVVANSKFVYDSFIGEGYPEGKIVYIPTGCPRIRSIQSNVNDNKAPLRFLYVGTLSLRKGVLYLLQAWKEFAVNKNEELWLAGQTELPKEVIESFGSGIHYYGSLPKKDLELLYVKANVFILPTLCEGLAHVILEALAYGLPVITTKESGAEGLVSNDRNGFIINAEDSNSILSAMEWCLYNRAKLTKMGEQSRLTAKDWTISKSNAAHLSVIQHYLKYGEITEWPGYHLP